MKRASTPLEQFQQWAQLNDVQLCGIQICPNIVTADGISKGGGLLSTASHEPGDVLLSINQDLILSKETVLQCAKFDKHFRDVIEALDDFMQTPRTAIVVFLLMQLTISSPDLEVHSVGVRSPFTNYFSSLPKDIPLPTFLSDEEREMLTGTSLSDALNQKLFSLQREFDYIKERTESLEWCQKAWWNSENGHLTFNDWLLCDALYRSRALELPKGVGDAMVPVLDMANHSADDRYNARFEVGEDGRILLVVRDGRQIQTGEEVCITYGCGGASEMIFSYGFLEENVQSAREMFLSLDAPEDDPLRIAKKHFAKEAPGIRIFTNTQGRVSWESAFIWWICINEEDGLDFEVLQTNDGDRELQALWKGRELDPELLKSTLMQDPRWKIFLLRATVTIQQRVEKQGEELSLTQAYFDENPPHTPDSRKFVHEAIRQLRTLELDLLMASFGTLEDEKQQLLKTRTVTEYLSGTSVSHESEGHQEEDFS